MDIYCPNCGEPWELDTFHDVAEERGTSWEEAISRFRRDGCVATGWCKPCEPRRTMRGEAMAILGDLLGDDIDGLASMLDDADYLGLLD